jgi:hypothetical protein
MIRSPGLQAWDLEINFKNEKGHLCPSKNNDHHTLENMGALRLQEIASLKPTIFLLNKKEGRKRPKDRGSAHFAPP